MTNTSWMLLALGALAACQQRAPTERSEDVGNAFQYSEVDDGVTRFYVGKQVMQDVQETGAFTPTTESWYTMIEVPSELIPEPGAVLTVSTCNPAFGDILVYDHTFVGVEEAIANRPNPPDPFISTTDDGEMINRFHVGDPFVYGEVQVGYDDAGHLLAGVVAKFLVEYDEGPANLRNGGMLIGYPFFTDADPDDPMLSDGGCEAPPAPF